MVGQGLAVPAAGVGQDMWFIFSSFILVNLSPSLSLSEEMAQHDLYHVDWAGKLNQSKYLIQFAHFFY